jgi:hypothetical protein
VRREWSISLAELIEFRTVNADGTPGEVVASATFAGGQVTYAGPTAEQTVQMLARRFRRTESAIFELMRDNGWSNGWLMAVNRGASMPPAGLPAI